MTPEQRIDPEDGVAYTFDELAEYYQGKYKKKQITSYWEMECTPIPKQRKSKRGKNTESRAKEGAEPASKTEKKKKAANDSTNARASPTKGQQLSELSRKAAAPEDVLNRIAACKVVPVVTIDDVSHACPLAQALKQGNIDVVEITFRSECAAAAMKEVSSSCDGTLVGAGTVLSKEQVDIAINAGADFIVSPGFDLAVATRCSKRKIMYLPGVVTPTEIMAVSGRFKLKTLKFFPASNFGGAATLKSYSAVFPQIKFMPTGGVTLENIIDFVSLPNVVAAGGSWMVSSKLVLAAAESGDWSHVTAEAQKAHQAVNPGDTTKP